MKHSQIISSKSIIAPALPTESHGATVLHAEIGVMNGRYVRAPTPGHSAVILCC